jgi:glycerate kinase
MLKFAISRCFELFTVIFKLAVVPCSGAGAAGGAGAGVCAVAGAAGAGFAAVFLRSGLRVLNLAAGHSGEFQSSIIKYKIQIYFLYIRF